MQLQKCLGLFQLSCEVSFLILDLRDFLLDQLFLRHFGNIFGVTQMLSSSRNSSLEEGQVGPNRTFVSFVTDVAHGQVGHSLCILDLIRLQQPPGRVLRLRYSISFLLVPRINLCPMGALQLVTGPSQLLTSFCCLCVHRLRSPLLDSCLLDTLRQINPLPLLICNTLRDAEPFRIHVHERFRCDGDNVPLHSLDLLRNNVQLFGSQIDRINISV